MTTARLTLFHYTCSHGRRGVSARGWLKPNPQPVLSGAPLIWLTDQAQPDRVGLGLTSHILDCDRLQFRYLVESDEPMPWRQWIGRQSPRLFAQALAALHGQGRQPSRWFVAQRPLWAELDRAYPEVGEVSA